MTEVTMGRWLVLAVLGMLVAMGCGTKCPEHHTTDPFPTDPDVRAACGLPPLQIPSGRPRDAGASRVPLPGGLEGPPPGPYPAAAMLAVPGCVLGGPGANDADTVTYAPDRRTATILRLPTMEWGTAPTLAEPCVLSLDLSAERTDDAGTIGTLSTGPTITGFPVTASPAGCVFALAAGADGGVVSAPADLVRGWAVPAWVGRYGGQGNYGFHLTLEWDFHRPYPACGGTAVTPAVITEEVL